MLKPYITRLQETYLFLTNFGITLIFPDLFSSQTKTTTYRKTKYNQLEKVFLEYVGEYYIEMLFLLIDRNVKNIQILGELIY